MASKLSMTFIKNQNARNKSGNKTSPDFIGTEVTAKVRAFHKSFPEYEPTPLQNLEALAKTYGVEAIWVKDESYRFGLNAFKVLGGSYAIGKYLAERLDTPLEDLSFEKLKSKEMKEKMGEITFVTATDGNHGRGIAWAARELGQKAVVYMPKGSSQIRLDNIRNEGAEASITELNYDDAVRLANRYAEDHNGVLVQDSSWEGYMDIPTWIMQGYATLVDEAVEQIKGLGHERPTHVFLQAGVGSFAGSILGYLVSAFGDNYPVTVVVEPDEAACLFKSMKIADGEPHAVTGDMPTIMAGLACGEPSLVAWGVLRDYADGYLSCPDAVAAKGMRILGNPLKGDPQVISGESGAVGMGVLSLLTQSQDYKDLAEQLKLDKNSKILIISTEGDTDPENYRSIVWDGAYPTF